METLNMSQPVAEGSRAEKSRKLLIAGTVLIILAGIVWYFGSKPATVTAPGASSGTANQPTETLGAALYQSASNPVSGKLPETVAPVPNPIQGLYTNPF